MPSCVGPGGVTPVAVVVAGAEVVVVGTAVVVVGAAVVLLLPPLTPTQYAYPGHRPSQASPTAGFQATKSDSEMPAVEAMSAQ